MFLDFYFFGANARRHPFEGLVSRLVFVFSSQDVQDTMCNNNNQGCTTTSVFFEAVFLGNALRAFRLGFLIGKRVDQASSRTD